MRLSLSYAGNDSGRSFLNRERIRLWAETKVKSPEFEPIYAHEFQDHSANAERLLQLDGRTAGHMNSSALFPWQLRKIFDQSEALRRTTLPQSSHIVT